MKGSKSRRVQESKSRSGIVFAFGLFDIWTFRLFDPVVAADAVEVVGEPEVHRRRWEGEVVREEVAGPGEEVEVAEAGEARVIAV
jgi:hypothetical protein